MSANQSMCQEVEDRLSEVLDGTASARLFDHVASCDACRDLRYEASKVVEQVGASGLDFRPADDFIEKLAASLAEARPEDHAPGSLGSAPAASLPSASVAVVSSTRDTARSGITSVVVHRSNTEPGMETAATVFDPLAAAKAEEMEAQSRRVPPTKVAITAPEPAGPTVPSEVDEPAPASAPKAEVKAEPAPEPILITARAEKAKPKPAKASLLRRPGVILALTGALAAAAATAFYVKSRPVHPDSPTAQRGPWSGSVATVARASADKTGGLEACDGATCAAVESGAAIRPGATLRTDARTRAHVALADGTELAIDRATEVVLSKDKDRSARITHGSVVADVSHVEGSNAHFWFARGDVEVVGTKLAITATDDRASVEVARGTVRFRRDGGKWVDVRAGEEATVLRDQEPVVASSTSMADVMEWSNEKAEDVDSPVLRGLGELRARRPGQTKEKDHAVRLAKHAVKVRIVDVVARTEVDETFSNDTDEELEGIFRFPLPPGAQIEKLTLEVDGKMIDGAFVDRDKGAAIWRGVIQNAAPQTPRPREEIIWVPGPWRDPALLEWQRGGRFELKIFPIPKRGSRRVALTYTQLVDQSAGIRRFTYPLAHDPSGTTKIDSFDVDLQVLGADKSVGLQTRGYELASTGGDVDRRTMHADGFVPAGDLTVEYALPDRDKELTSWAYATPAGDVHPVSPLPGGAPSTPEQKAAVDTAQAILNDASPYVAIALRPKLPRWQEAKERLHVIVVDTSRSMFGERASRARLLASSIVREMDRRDSFMVLACDTVCQPMTTEAGGAARPEAPSAGAAEEVERFLGGIEPDGGSDLAAAMSAARAAASAAPGKELRVLYLGDGTPSVGPTRAAHLETAVRSALGSSNGGDSAVVAVALGADADTPSLTALARGGGGVVVPYVPGQKVASAALDVLGAAYGVVLRDAEIELPAGLTQVSPGRLDPIRAGGETVLVARMSSGSEIEGSVKLRGRVAGEKFEQTYPLKVIASSSAGNAFVPRLYAAAKIADLERDGGEAMKPTVIELSKRFAVASRFTSLLVLESEAMFKAFGLQRGGSASAFTGEVGAQSSSADADGDGHDDVADAEQKPGEDQGFGNGHGRLAGGSHREKDATKSPRRAMDTADPFMDEPMDRDQAAPATGTLGSLGGDANKGGYASPPAVAAASPAPAATMAPSQQPKPDDAFDMKVPPQGAPAKKSAGPGGFGGGGWAPPRPPTNARRMIPMRKVFDRKVSFDSSNTFASLNAAKLLAAESSLAVTPDSRDKTVDLFALYATSGRVNEAQELTAKWAGRDALDPDALTARADLAARQGDRDRAVRILGGLADVRPNDRAVQVRLADLQDTAGHAALACEHRIALADLAPGEAKLVADAVRCSRVQGFFDLANRLELDAPDKVRDAVAKLLVAAAPAPKGLTGDVQVSAEWTGGGDLDVALIDAQGKRTSWLGAPGRATVTARDATSDRAEALALAGLPQGNYVVEISRASGGDAGAPTRGDVTLRLGGDVRRVPFVLNGPRAEVGTIRVFFTARLVPVEFGWRF